MSENLKSFDSGVVMSVDEICRIIDKLGQEFDGFTISGGEPFLQIDELVELTERLSATYTDDIIIFTGYNLEQLKNKFNERVASRSDKIFLKNFDKIKSR